MLILGIDTSCDDTSLALLESPKKICSHIVSSQSDLHTHFGGIVPEIASRKHVERIGMIFDSVLSEAGAVPADIDVVSVTAGPTLWLASVLLKACVLALTGP